MGEHASHVSHVEIRAQVVADGMDHAVGVYRFDQQQARRLPWPAVSRRSSSCRLRLRPWRSGSASCSVCRYGPRGSSGHPVAPGSARWSAERPEPARISPPIPRCDRQSQQPRRRLVGRLLSTCTRPTNTWVTHRHLQSVHGSILPSSFAPPPNRYSRLSRASARSMGGFKLVRDPGPEGQPSRLGRPAEAGPRHGPRKWAAERVIHRAHRTGRCTRCTSLHAALMFTPRNSLRGVVFPLVEWAVGGLGVVQGPDGVGAARTREHSWRASVAGRFGRCPFRCRTM